MKCGIQWREEKNTNEIEMKQSLKCRKCCRITLTTARQTVTAASSFVRELLRWFGFVLKEKSTKTQREIENKQVSNMIAWMKNQFSFFFSFLRIWRHRMNNSIYDLTPSERWRVSEDWRRRFVLLAEHGETVAFSLSFVFVQWKMTAKWLFFSRKVRSRKRKNVRRNAVLRRLLLLLSFIFFISFAASLLTSQANKIFLFCSLLVFNRNHDERKKM